MYRVRAAGILLLGVVWMAGVAAADEGPPTQTPQEPGINADAPRPLLPGETDATPVPCGSETDVAAPVLGAGALADAGNGDGDSTSGPSASFLSQGTVHVPTSNLVALGIVVGLSFGGAAGLAASRLTGLRHRVASRGVAPTPLGLPNPAPVAPPAPALPAVATPAATTSPPPTQPQSHLERLVGSVKANPMDGKSHFDLALELMRRNEVELGMRHLSTSFALYPQGVLRLLEDPTLVKIREHPEVVFALRTLHREQQRRFTGYV